MTSEAMLVTTAAKVGREGGGGSLNCRVTEKKVKRIIA